MGTCARSEVGAEGRSFILRGTRGRWRCACLLLHGGEHPLTCAQANDDLADLNLGAEQPLFQLGARMTDELGAILPRLGQPLFGLRDKDEDVLAAFLDIGHRRARFPERHSGDGALFRPFAAIGAGRT